jgi:hypothetical protein
MGKKWLIEEVTGEGENSKGCARVFVGVVFLLMFLAWCAKN